MVPLFAVARVRTRRADRGAIERACRWTAGKFIAGQILHPGACRTGIFQAAGQLLDLRPQKSVTEQRRCAMGGSPMGIAAVALVAVLAVPATDAPATSPRPPTAAQEQAVSRPPPRAATELVARPAEPAPADPAGVAVGEPAPTGQAQPPADPALSGGAAAATPPSSAAPSSTNPQPPPAAAPGASAAAPSPPPASATDAPPAAPGFSTPVASPPPVVSSAGPALADPPRGPPPAWPWAALALLLLAAAAGYQAVRGRRARLAARTRAMLALEPRLDRGPAVQPPPRLAFAGPPAAIQARLEPGAARTWTE